MYQGLNIKQQSFTEILFIIHGSWIAVCKRSSFHCSQSESCLHLIRCLVGFFYPFWRQAVMVMLLTTHTFWRSFLFLSDGSKKKLHEEIDEFSDSYYWDLDLSDIKQVKLYSFIILFTFLDTWSINFWSYYVDVMELLHRYMEFWEDSIYFIYLILSSFWAT